MKNLHYLLLLSLFVYIAKPGAAQWENNYPDHNSTEYIAGGDNAGTVTMLVTVEGKVLRSEKIGEMFYPVTPEITDPAIQFADLAMKDENIAVIVGTKGTIMYTFDGGQSWTEASSQPGGSHIIRAVYQWGSNSWIAVGNGGKIWRSFNTTNNWASISSPTTENLYDVFVINDGGGYVAWACGNNGTIAYSNDGFVTGWGSQTSGVTSHLYAIDGYDNDHAFIVGEGGEVLSTSNSGSTWNDMATEPTSYDLLDIHIVNSGTFVVSGKSGALYQTVDAGSNYTDRSDFIVNDLHTIVSFGSTDSMIVGGTYTQYLKRSVNSGTSFTNRYLTFNYFNDLDFINADTGWYASQSGLIYKTETGGRSLEKVTRAGIGDVRGVDFVDYDNGWAVTELGAIVYSNDGGDSWVPQETASNELYAIKMLSTTVGIACGQNGKVMRTIDGANWSATGSNPSSTTDLKDCHFFDSERGFVCGESGAIFKTENGGSSWSTITTGTTDNIEGIDFADDSTGYYVTDQGEIYKTTDGGDNWTEILNTNKKLYDVHFLDEMNGWACGWNAASDYAIRTYDGGTTWIDQSLHMNGTAYALSFPDGDINNGHIATTYHNLSTSTGGYPTIAMEYSTTDLTCYNDNSGEIDLTITNVSSPSTDWADGPTTADRTGLDGGWYTVSITKSSDYYMHSFYVDEPVKYEITDEAYQNLDCYMDNSGEITVTASGGTGTLSYDIGSGTQGSPNFTGLSATTYQVTVSDANSCELYSTSFGLTQPALLKVDIISTDSVSCNGLSDGAIDASISGGTATYAPVWSNGTSAEDISSLSAASYIITVTDAKGCEASNTATVKQPASLVANITGSSSPDCYGGSDGSASLNVSGGTPSYTYLWSSGETIEDALALPGGTAYVTVTDAKGCTDTDNQLVSEPSQVGIASLTINDETCSGSGDGSISITGSGGDSNFDYNIGSGPQGSGSFTSLTTGSYTITVTDGNSCPYVKSGLSVSAGVEVSLSTSITQDIECNGDGDGALNASATSPNGGITYAWSTSDATADITGLDPGTYYVTATDASSCFSMDSATLTQPEAISMSIDTSIDITCFGLDDGKITVTGTGGTGTLGYDIGTTDNTTGSFTSLAAGAYTLTITDGNSCEYIAGSAITLTQPDSMAISGSVTDASCASTCLDGAIDVSVTGGTADYSYLWSNDVTTQDLSDVATASYIINVSDQNGCSLVDTFTVGAPDDTDTTDNDDDTTSVYAIASVESISLYPNPVVSELNIDIELSEYTELQIELVNAFGLRERVLLDQTLSAGSYAFDFGLGDQSPGVYFIMINNKKQTLSYKIVILN